MQRVRSFEETPYATKAVLRNGLTVIVHEFRAHPLAHIATYVPCGFHREPETSAGLSRILARMFFKSTAAKDAGAVSRDIHAMGGMQSSTGTPDGSFHDLLVPSAQWKKALEVHAEALQNLSPDSGDIGGEYARMLREDAARRADPDAQAWSELMGIAFGANRYSFGTPEAPADSTPPSRDRLLEYYRAACSPSRAILVVAGAVNASEVLTEVVRLYDRQRPPAAGPSPRAGRTSQGEFRYGAVAGTGSIGAILAGFHVAPASSADWPALEVLRAMLGSGEESVLAHRLRDGRKAILQGEVRLETCEDGGYFAFNLRVEPDAFDRAEIGLMTELEILKRSEPELAEIERAKAQLERDCWLNQGTLSGRSHGLIRHEAMGDWKKWNQVIPQIRRVKPSDITRVARNYFRIENCALVESLPSGAERQNVSAETLRSTLVTLLETSVAQELAERERETRPAIDLPGPPEAFKPIEVAYPVRRASILRGPELYIHEDHTLPLLCIGFFYPGGKLFENPGNSGITSLLLKTLLCSSREDEACRLRRQLEIYGGSLIPVVEDDFFGFVVHVLSRFAEPSLQILGRLLELPNLEKENLDRLRRLQLASMPNPQHSSPSGAIEKLNRVLFGEHPYGLAPAGSEAAIGRISSEELKAWYTANVRNKKPIVVITGDTQGTSLAGFFVRRFSGSRFQEVRLPDAYVKAVEKSSILEEKRQGGPGMALIGFQAPPAADEDASAVSVLQSHMAGPNGRLAEALRQKLNAGTDASMVYVPRARGGSCVLYGLAPPGEEQHVSGVIEEEIRSLLERPMVYRDYRAAVNAAVATHLFAQESRTDRILALAKGIVAGESLEEIIERAVRLQQVTEEDLDDVIHRVFNLDRSVILRILSTLPMP
ncbi:MAG: insulinase family protein [Acidobacteria bacterium]|nr:insulinase family protein [Acidobacteriota bacterium]